MKGYFFNPKAIKMSGNDTGEHKHELPLSTASEWGKLWYIWTKLTWRFFYIFRGAAQHGICNFKNWQHFWRASLLESNIYEFSLPASFTHHKNKIMTSSLILWNHTNSCRNLIACPGFYKSEQGGYAVVSLTFGMLVMDFHNFRGIYSRSIFF